MILLKVIQEKFKTILISENDNIVKINELKQLLLKVKRLRVYFEDNKPELINETQTLYNTIERYTKDDISL